MSSKEDILAYILKFSREEDLIELEAAILDAYPTTEDYPNYNAIPPQALYHAIDSLETTREENETREVRDLMEHYDKIYALPDDITSGVRLPQQTTIYDHTTMTDYPFGSNILTTTHHPKLQNIFISTTSSRDIVVMYIPEQTAATTTQPKPIVLAVKYGVLPAVALSSQIVLAQNKDDAAKVDMFVVFGLIDGHVDFFRVNTFALDNTGNDQVEFTETNHLVSLFPKPTFPLASLPTTTTTDDTEDHPHNAKIHAKYVTRLLLPQGDDILPTTTTHFNIISASHDQTVALSTIDLTTFTCQRQHVAEFKGRVETICGISHPHVLQSTDALHPIQAHPQLIPTKQQSRYHLSKIRKLHKGNYLDNVEFVTHGIPFPDFKTTTATYPLIAVSVRNDSLIHFLNAETLQEVDTINVNITGDNHISFAVLDFAYDQYHGVLYCATDHGCVLVLDIITKQHIRRLYSTENGEMSSPIIKLLHTPNPAAAHGGALDQFPQAVVAITTATNNIKLYNPQTQKIIKEYTGSKKNIKSFTVLRTTNSTTNAFDFNFITTGFDKSFVIQF